MKRTSNVLLVLTVVFCLVSLLWSAAVNVTFGLALALAVTSIATPNDKEIGQLIPFHAPTGQHDKAA